MNRDVRIAPSILAADPLRLGEQLEAISSADYVHFDVMDGVFVPNLTFGPGLLAKVKEATNVPVDVHLMITEPDRRFMAYLDAGADMISFHYEAQLHAHRTIYAIKDRGAKAAIAINPETDVIRLKEYLGIVDEVLVMTVHPGFGAQKFIGECLDKVRWIRARKPDLDIMVDGGVNGETAAECVRAGVNMLVSGSYLYKQADMKKAMEDMRNV